VTRDHLFAWAVGVSIGTHMAGLAGATALGVWPDSASIPPVPVPIEVVRAEPEPTPPPPPPAAPLKPPRMTETPKAVVENRLAIPALLPDTAELAAPALPESRLLTGNALITRGHAPVPLPREGGEAGAGQLFATGDIPIQPGRGLAAGSGANGRGGLGLATRGDGAQAAASGPGGGTLTAMARPLGGYQHMPTYPESARREGVEGVATLRFQVLIDGSVGTVNVQHSAGHPDLDQAAIEAVKKWRFEPARRGTQAVAVWVTLPVRFELKR
jgi:protein TonB